VSTTLTFFPCNSLWIDVLRSGKAFALGSATREERAMESLRVAERRWQTTGSVEDEASYLWAAVNAGVLGIRRLTFAARLYYPAALLALSGDPSDRPESYDAWAEDMSLGRGRVLWRLFLCDAQRKLRRLEDGLNMGSQPPNERAVDGCRLLAGDLACVRAHLFDPTNPGRLRHVNSLADSGGGFFDEAIVAGLERTPDFLEVEAAIGSLAHAVAYGSPREELSAEPALLAALHADVVPWALRYSDPLDQPEAAETAETLHSLREDWLDLLANDDDDCVLRWLLATDQGFTFPIPIPPRAA
jgi:hypothetical protein